MARIRSIKPEFFRHHGLYVAEREAGLPLRIAFAGLWTVCDREGRFKWKPEEIKLDCLPYDDVDFVRMLDELATRGFIVRYTSGGRDYGWVPGFGRHQVINGRESNSKLPAPPETVDVSGEPTRDAREGDASVTRHNPAQGEGKGREEEEEKEGKGAEDSAARWEGGAPPLFVQIVQALDGAIVSVFGKDQGRLHPHQDDGSHAKRFIEKGADLDLCREVFLARCQRAKAKGKRPPYSLEYFEDAIADAIATRDRPMPEGRPNVQFFDPASEAKRIAEQRGAA